MLVSWDWLKQYVALDMPREELELRLMMAGLNHEGTEQKRDDFAIDLEVTSNRPDCLGHIGVAREVSVLYDQELLLPAADPQESDQAVESLAKVTLNCPELCSRYTARVIRGVTVGPSPDWMIRRLETIGVAPINNVVDITNYVLMECGQPLHAFDLSRLEGQEIIVRPATAGEEFFAINHKKYSLEPGDCVIADARRPVALGGVMGGADSEVSAESTDLMIESAMFDPVSIRTTARRLVLQSESSFRFERGPDPAGVDWASRRCCDLVLELAGGRLAAGLIDVGQPPPVRQTVTLRFDQLQRILGISIDGAETARILSALGCTEQRSDDAIIEVTPPTWRNDLTREIDLVEEVARIHGYEAIPEDAMVPMAPSARRDVDRILEKVRMALTAGGFDEAITASVVDNDTSGAFSPWNDSPPLSCDIPLLRGATLLRRSLVPSLLSIRRLNESLANPVIELFEIANVYLPRPGQLPDEEKMIALTSGQDYYGLKGTLEAMLASLNPALALEIADTSNELFAARHCCELRVGNALLGYLGEVSDAGRGRFDLKRPTTVAELRLAPLVERADLFPKQVPTSPYPAVERDLNFEVAESVRWSDLEAAVRASAGQHLEQIRYLETYRDQKRLGADRKSLVLKVILRRTDGTLTGEQADQVRESIVATCKDKLDAVLRA